MSDENALRRHREALVEQYRAIVEAYDKAILSLGGGALGVSFVFVRDLRDELEHQYLLLASWLMLAGSIAVIVGSFMISQLLYRRMILAIDAGTADKYKGRFGRTGMMLSLAGGVALVIGVCTLGLFIWLNLSF